MRNYRIFVKKELVEAFKTYKLLIMGAVFLVFGIMSPITAKMTPELLRWAMQTDPSTAGMDLTSLFTEPKALDAWSQFYSNTGQIGLIVLVIVFSGMLSSELSKGTITIILTKGLSRATVILSKLTSAALVWTGSLAISFFVSWGYTAYLFPGKSLPNIIFAISALWAGGVFLLALTTLAAAITKTSSIFCMLATGAAVIALNLLNLAPLVRKYNPISLLNAPLSVLSASATPRTFFAALAAAIIGIVVLAIFAIIVFVEKNALKKSAVIALLFAFAMLLTVFIGEEYPARIGFSRYATSEKITIGAGTEWELSGLLTIPKGAGGNSKLPAVVLVQGSGASDMDETIFDNKPFREIAEYLTKNGIAAIRYNKRTYTHGVKMSEDADSGLTVWDETIEDAILATSILKSDPRIDENRVFILGHSLGGMLAPRIHAMGGDYAGLILFAGSPRFLLDIMKDQQSLFLDLLDEGEEKTKAAAANEKFNSDVEKGLTLPDDEAKKMIIEGGGSSAYYFKDLYEHPATDYIAHIDAPFLVIQGADDFQVYVDKDFKIYEEMLAGRPNATFKLYDGLNHLFMPAKAESIDEIMDEYRKKAHIDKQVLADIAEWIKMN